MLSRGGNLKRNSIKTEFNTEIKESGYSMAQMGGALLLDGDGHWPGQKF